jgi:hypothetical protein
LVGAVPSMKNGPKCTALSHSPGASAHALVGANGSQAVHDDVLLMHIEATPLASVAASARVTVGRRVHAALLLILTDPVGGSASTVTESAVPCAVPPSLVARMLSRRTRPFAAAMPVATQVNVGIAPVTTAGCQLLRGGATMIGWNGSRTSRRSPTAPAFSS